MKLMKKLLGVVFASALVLTMVGCGGSKDAGKKDADKTAGEPVVKIGTCADFPPYEYLEGEEITGLEIELVKTILKDAGMKPEFQNMDFDGMLTALSSGKVDMAVAGLSVTPDREKTFDFTRTIFDNTVHIMFKKDKPYETKDDLKGKKVGFQTGTTAGDFISENLKDSEGKGYASYTQAIMDLENGKLDAIIMDQVPAERMIKEKKDLALSKEPLYKDKYAFAVKKGQNPELLKTINDGIEKLKKDGKYDEIVNKYFK